MYYKKIVGSHAYLVPVEKQNNMELWSDDLKNNFNFNKISASSSSSDENFSLTPKLKLDYDLFSIIPIDNDTDSPIGTISINEVNHEYKTGRLDLFIQNKLYIKNGVGHNAVKLVLDYAFNLLNLLNVNLMVFEYNDKFIKLYSSCGFKKCGKIRQAKEVAGKRYDLILMDILSSEYKPLKKIEHSNIFDTQK